MKTQLFLLYLFLTLASHSQDTIPISKIDTPINFFRSRPLRLHPYNNRVVPFDSYNPLYVQITYEDGKSKNFEYFRIDSSTYLVYEYFRSGKGSSNEGLKSSGIVKVTNEIAGVSTTRVMHNGSQENKYTKEIHRYKALSKEGEWNEYEDSLFNHRYWTGIYLNNKKVGIWSNYVYDPNGDKLIQQIDYDKDSTKRIFTTNIVGQLTIDSIDRYLIGRWPIACEDDNDVRNPMMKCQPYDGHYGNDCNDRFEKISYYEFLEHGKFKRQKGEGCKRPKNYLTTGNWKLTMLKEKLTLVITLTNNTKILYHIWYIDREGNMVADRQ